MSEKNFVNTGTNTFLTWLTAIVVVVLGIGAFAILPNLATNDDVASAVGSIDIPTVNVPTAKEIAAEIVISEGSSSSGGYSGNLNQDILQKVYENESREIETDCTEGLKDEFSVNDRLDDIQDLIEDSIGEDITDLKIETLNYQDEYDFIVTNLGLRDKEDREARITSTIRVSYELEDGNGDDITDKVYAKASCSDWDNDKDEEEFDDLTVEYSLNDRY